jgi:hypothetical protein
LGQKFKMPFLGQKPKNKCFSFFFSGDNQQGGPRPFAPRGGGGLGSGLPRFGQRDGGGLPMFGGGGDRPRSSQNTAAGGGGGADWTRGYNLSECCYFINYQNTLIKSTKTIIIYMKNISPIFLSSHLFCRMLYKKRQNHKLNI